MSPSIGLLILSVPVTCCPPRCTCLFDQLSKSVCEGMLCVCLCSTLTRIAQNDFYPIMYMHISCVGLCVHGFMNPMPSWFVCVFFSPSDVLTYRVMLQALYAIVLSSDVFEARARVRVCVCVCVCVVHWHCTAQLSMFNMEKRFRNKIIIASLVSFSTGSRFTLLDLFGFSSSIPATFVNAFCSV